MQELNQQWDKVLQKISLMVSSVSFDLWIKNSQIIEQDGNTLVIGAYSATAKARIQKNYYEQLKQCVLEVFGENLTLVILDPDERNDYLLKNNPSQDEGKSLKQEDQGTAFNSKYTFDNFVVGKSNQYVYAAARAVAENPGKKFNPLFIYSGVGLGKTHILHAIGNYIKAEHPELKILYVTCETFTNDYIESMSLKSVKPTITSELREKYRNVDVLMIDDIQFISNKTGTQEEFFHTFNDLHQNNKQIIISSDRPPKEIAKLEERMRSRFASGLIQDMQTPDVETRIAILRKKAMIERYYVDDDAIEYIAEHVDTNVRELEGVLSKVYFFANLLGKKSATIEDAREAIAENIEDKKESITAEQIINTVCDYFEITKADIIGKKKNKEIVEPRMIAIYLINEMIGMPLVNIGRLFGNRDHTTIIHARDKITEQVKENARIKGFVQNIKNSFN